MKLKTLVIIFLLTLAGQGYSYSALPAVAILNIEERAVNQTDAVLAMDFIREALVKSGKFIVIERENMEKILEEQKFQLSGCTTEDCAVKAGKLLNVQQMLLGSLNRTGDKYYISLRLINVEEGTIAAAETQEYEQATGLKKAVEMITDRLTGNNIQELKVEKTMSPEVKAAMSGMINNLNDKKKYYHKEVHTSWIVTGLGILLGINGAIWFEGSDRLMFGVLGGCLAVAGGVSLGKNYSLIHSINQDINALTLRINLFF